MFHLLLTAQTPDANLTYEHMRKSTPADVALHIGDISYATGYAAKWDMFMTQASQLASTIPLMTGLGNHEQDFPGKGLLIVSFILRLCEDQ